MSSATVTIEARLPPEVERDLRGLAEATGRSVSTLVAEAVAEYVAWQKQFGAAVQEGVQAADAGRLVDHENVAQKLERRYRDA